MKDFLRRNNQQNQWIAVSQRRQSYEAHTTLVAKNGYVERLLCRNGFVNQLPVDFLLHFELALQLEARPSGEQALHEREVRTQHA